ncbi:MAG: sialate O-acetylesterase [Verrucomicrobiota bacterium]
MSRFAGNAALVMLLCTSVQARTWTSADGSKTFEGELLSYDPATGAVGVNLAGGKAMKFAQDKLSAADITFLKEQGKVDAPPVSAPPADKTADAAPAAKSSVGKIDADPKNLLKKPDGKPADMSKPVQVFIIMGQSNAVGLGKLPSLEAAVKTKGKYSYLVDDTGGWIERKDVRNVFIMSLKLQHNDWMSVKNRNAVGLEYGLGHTLGNAIEAPVMILKSCIGNRSLGWDLLPPGSEPYDGQPGYRGTNENPKGTGEKPAAGWYAGKQYDDDVEGAKQILADLKTYYPEAKNYEVAGFFFWQGEKDGGNPVHSAHYEQNLVNFIKSVRKDFNAPNSKFVLATMGEAVKGSGNKVMEGQLAVDGKEGKHPEFKGNVATVYTHDMAQGGGGNGHYGGNSEVYMDVAEAMGQSMVELLKK